MLVFIVRMPSNNRTYSHVRQKQTKKKRFGPFEDLDKTNKCIISKEKNIRSAFSQFSLSCDCCSIQTISRFIFSFHIVGLFLVSHQKKKLVNGKIQIENEKRKKLKTHFQKYHTPAFETHKQKIGM